MDVIEEEPKPLPGQQLQIVDIENLLSYYRVFLRTKKYSKNTTNRHSTTKTTPVDVNIPSVPTITTASQLPIGSLQSPVPSSIQMNLPIIHSISNICRSSHSQVVSNCNVC